MINIEYLAKNANNIELVKHLILKDTSNMCFSNKDIEGNIIPIEYMAEIYLEYTKMFAIKLDEKHIGLLSLTNENEISIFIEPKYQNQGIGKKVLLSFIEIIRKKYDVTEIISEITEDNERCMKLITSIGFIECPDESRMVPINGIDTKVKKFVLK